VLGRLLSWLLGRPALATPAAWCPHCGTGLQTFWAEDNAVTTLGISADRNLPPGDHLVLRAECPCGWAGRANTARVLNPRQLSPR